LPTATIEAAVGGVEARRPFKGRGGSGAGRPFKRWMSASICETRERSSVRKWDWRETVDWRDEISWSWWKVISSKVEMRERASESIMSGDWWKAERSERSLVKPNSSESCESPEKLWEVIEIGVPSIAERKSRKISRETKERIW
jgi:hypothetical protein